MRNDWTYRPAGGHDVTFSIVKALGIICIVVGHAAVRTPLSPFVYLFHISLFFFVAGYFFRDDLPEKPFRYAAGKVRRLYMPYIGYGVTAVLLHNLLLRWQVIGYNFSLRTPILPYDGEEMLSRVGRVLSFTYYEQIMAPSWFLAALFFALIGFYLVTWFCKRVFPKHFQTVRTLLIAAVAAAAVLLASCPGLFRGQSFVCRIPVGMGLICLGRLYALWRGRIPLHPLWAAGCLLLLAGATAAGYRINVGGLMFGNPLIFLLLTVAGCYMTLTAARILALQGGAVSRRLDYLGRNTLTVMMLHLPAFKLVSLSEIVLYGYPSKYLAFHPVIPYHDALWWIPYTVVGIAVPLCFAWLYDRVKGTLARR